MCICIFFCFLTILSLYMHGNGGITTFRSKMWYYLLSLWFHIKGRKVWRLHNISCNFSLYFHYACAEVAMFMNFGQNSETIGYYNCIKEINILLIEIHFLMFLTIYFCNACAKMTVFLLPVENLILLSFSVASVLSKWIEILVIGQIFGCLMKYLTLPFDLLPHISLLGAIFRQVADVFSWFFVG